MKIHSLRWRLLWTIGLVVTLAMVSVGVFLRAAVHRQIERQEVELELRTSEGTMEMSREVETHDKVMLEADAEADPKRRLLAGLDRRLGIGIGIALALTICATWLLSRRILGPVEALTEGVRKVAAGDLSQRIDSAGRGDEVAELASAFNRMAASLEQTDELRRNLVNDVAHELRTPLTRLQVQLEAMIDGLAQASDERLQALLEDTRLLGRLVHDLEDLARAEAGQLRLDLEPIELEPILRAAVDAAGRAGDGAELSIDIEEGLPSARGDAQRLRQMVDNLLTNARTHTPPDGKICLSAHCAGNEIEIRVADTGPGLSEEEQVRVFERFYRGDPSRHRATGGAGLGLAIVAQLAAAQGGRAWVESELGEGARFVFSVPRA